MFYVYVLRSTRDDGLYTGCTHDLRSRFSQHNAGKVPSTRERRPFALIYYEACLNEQDAFKREKYLKTTYGKRFLKLRCKNYFTGQGEARQTAKEAGLSLAEAMRQSVELGLPKLRERLAARALTPFTPEEARVAFAPDPEWDAVTAAMSGLSIAGIEE